MHGNGILDEDMTAESGSSENTRNFQDLDQLPDAQAAELYAEFERRRRVSKIFWINFFSLFIFEFFFTQRQDKYM